MRLHGLLGLAFGGLLLAACSAGPQGAGLGDDPGASAGASDADASVPLHAEEQPAALTQWPLGQRPGVARYHGAGAKIEASPTCSSPKLTYFQGPIVMQPIIVPVFWSSHVNPTLTAPTTGIAQFFADVTVSSYWPWLQQYDTVGLAGGSEQAVLSGTATAGVTLVPSRCASTTSCTLTDAQIQAELDAQIGSGALPAPQVDCTNNSRTIYMIEFPPNVTVDGPAGAGRSCVQFCAYHNTGTYGASKIPLLYGVLMDEFTSACKTGCGSNATPLENSTDTASHELAETVTDPDIGLLPSTATQIEAPVGWYDANNQCGEIGDICDDGSAGDTITVSGRTWTVQELWSNKPTGCVSTGTTPAICSGTTVTNCRLCSCGDNGGACSGGTPVCETTSTNVVFGGCEQCTSKNATCAASQTCQQSTTPAKDDVCSACTPITSCPAGDTCGTVSDGCGGTVDCGTCTSPQTCGGGSPGNPNVCGCTPETACPAGDTCGTVPDGCGATVACGACTSGETCVANTCVTPTVDAGSASDSGANGDSGTTTSDSGTGDSGGEIDSGSASVDSGSATTADSGSATTADSGAGTTEDSGSGTTADSGSVATEDSGSTSTADSGSSPSEDSGTVATSDSGIDGATESDAMPDGSPAGPLSGSSGGCGCRTAQAREAGPSPALLAFGVLALLGGARLRRRTRA